MLHYLCHHLKHVSMGNGFGFDHVIPWLVGLWGGLVQAGPAVGGSMASVHVVAEWL